MISNNNNNSFVSAIIFIVTFVMSAIAYAAGPVTQTESSIAQDSELARNAQLMTVIEKQNNEIEFLTKLLTNRSYLNESVKLTSKDVEQSKVDKMSYADMAAISISSVSVLVTIIAIVIAVLSFWGYQSLKKMVAAEATKTATDEIAIKIHQVVRTELANIVDNGQLNKSLEAAVDLILRRQDCDNNNNVQELLTELDAEDSQESK